MAGDLAGTRLGRRPRQCMAALVAGGLPLQPADDRRHRNLDPVFARPLEPSHGGAGDAAGLAEAAVRQARARLHASTLDGVNGPPRDSHKLACKLSKSAIVAAAPPRSEFSERARQGPSSTCRLPSKTSDQGERTGRPSRAGAGEVRTKAKRRAVVPCHPSAT